MRCLKVSSLVLVALFLTVGTAASAGKWVKLRKAVKKAVRIHKAPIQKPTAMVVKTTKIKHTTQRQAQDLENKIKELKTRKALLRKLRKRYRQSQRQRVRQNAKSKHHRRVAIYRESRKLRGIERQIKRTTREMDSNATKKQKLLMQIKKLDMERQLANGRLKKWKAQRQGHKRKIQRLQQWRSQRHQSHKQGNQGNAGSSRRRYRNQTDQAQAQKEKP